MKLRKDALQKAYEKLKPKKKLGTSLDEKKKQKQKDQEEEEKLAILGQESERKAKKWIREEIVKKAESDRLTFGSELEWLRSKRKFRDEEYLIALASILWQRMKEVDFPLNYHWKVEIEGRKIRTEFIDRFGRKFAKGFKACGEPKFDHHAVGKVAIEAENTLDWIEGSLEGRKTETGIFLP